MRTTPQPASVAGVPVSLGGLTIGRSSSPASRGAPPSAAYQASGLGQRVLPTADHAGQVRYHLPMHAATNSGGPFGGIRDPAYLRANVSVFQVGTYVESAACVRIKSRQFWSVIYLVLLRVCA